MERVRELRLERPNEPGRRSFCATGTSMSPSAVRAAAERAGPCAPKAVLLALRYPGIRLLLVRRTYQELENNHIRFLRAQLRGNRGLPRGGAAVRVSGREHAGVRLLRL